MGAVEFSPLAFGLAQELKDHGQRRLAAAIAFGLPGAMAHGGESAFDGVGRPQVGPVFGVEALQAFKHEKLDVPVVSMSGYDEQEAFSRFHGNGLAGFVMKPFDPETLMLRIKKALT